ncbi:hypothetical protein GCM10010168_71080 [Actinoplanes ianthinogenes]|uniref:Fibronectin type-III domain-containing protein n=2 Tax=Actinoplanes ianthinogenes TaxID=122358 RepID=A0ABM7M6M2_9ACTN|nr:hypothetical protein Aiant_79600 [Actinoplanes ianthinogenes]GGR42118.1 hypothetical protein GCM10010168_71080 [Actinoplanes ianthinogenes]
MAVAAMLAAPAFAEPVQATPVVQILQMSAGGAHTCVLADDTNTYCWGSDDLGRLGDGAVTEQPFFGPAQVDVPAGVTFTQLAAGGPHNCALGDDSQAYCWGYGLQGQLGTGDREDRVSPAPVNTPAGVTFTQLAAGSVLTCGLARDGSAYCWGPPYTLGADSPTEFGPLRVASPSGVFFTQVTAGSDNACGLTGDGTAYCWGGNYKGQLGDGSTLGRTAPVPVAMPAGVTFTQLDTNGGHSCGLTASGTAYCWGDNASGQLGVGDTTNRLAPAPVAMPAGVRFTAVKAGGYHTCGLTGDGEIYCWGAGGAIGSGDMASRSTPFPVAAPAGVTFTQLTVGWRHTCALGDDRRGYCWGLGSYGRLGNGGDHDSLIPAKTLPIGTKPADPQPPIDVTATAGDRKITVSWAAPDLGDGPLINYRVSVSPGDRGCTSMTTLTCTVDGLYNGTAYTVTVVAETTIGTSAPSQALAAVTPDPVADDSGPVVTVTPGDRALVRSVHFSTTVTATDPAGISRSFLAGPDGAGSPASYTRGTVLSGADGARTVTWIVVDNRGNRTTTSRTVIVDNTPPAVAFGAAPKAGAKLARATTLTATASDRNGIARVELLVNGKPVAAATRAGYTFTLNPAKYGTRFTVQLRAYDRAGNVRSTSRRTYRR